MTQRIGTKGYVINATGVGLREPLVIAKGLEYFHTTLLFGSYKIKVDVVNYVKMNNVYAFVLYDYFYVFLHSETDLIICSIQ